MVKEKGIIVKVNSTTAWVKTIKSSACKSCESRDKCSTMGGGKEIIVETINTANGKLNDNVVIGFNSSSLFKLSFLLYVFPILCMIAGAATGDMLATYSNNDNSLFQAISGFACFGISVIFIRYIGKKLAPQKKYKSEVIKIINRKNI